MADALTTILRCAGEVPDPALLRCELTQAFARVILCLRSLKHEEALAISTSDPAQAARLNTASERRAELSVRLEFMGELTCTPGHSNRMLIHAARLMRTGLCAHAGRGYDLTADRLVAGDVLMPRSEGRLARQTAMLVQEALDLFKAIPGHDRRTSHERETRPTHQPARPPLNSAGGKAQLREAVAKALVHSARKMSARFLGSTASFSSAA